MEADRLVILRCRYGVVKRLLATGHQNAPFPFLGCGDTPKTLNQYLTCPIHKMGRVVEVERARDPQTEGIVTADGLPVP